MPAPRLTHQGRFSDRAKRYYKYCQDLKMLAMAAKFAIPARYDITFFVRMPDSWPALKKVRSRLTPCNTRPAWFDLDNLVKGFSDALCEDDSFVYEIRARKFWDNDGRIEVFTIR